LRQEPSKPSPMVVIRGAAKLRGFMELTGRALEEEDGEKLIDLLMKRELITDHILQDQIRFDEEETLECLAREMEVSARLENERKKILEDLDRLSANIKAIQVYSTRFPLPAMPAFFHRRG
jgi:hypothetical protein